MSSENYEKRENSQEREENDHDDEKREEKNEDDEKREEQKEELKLFVGNIDNVSGKELDNLFNSKLSSETEFKRIKDNFGFILTTSQQDYDDALKMDGVEVDGVKIIIAKANRRGQNRDNVRDKPSVFVKNLSFSSDRKSIEDCFGKCGEIVDVYLPQNKEREGHRGFCYVRFNTESGQKKGLELNGADLDGREIYVDLPRSIRGYDRRGGGYDRRGGNDRRGGYERRDYERRDYERRDHGGDRRGGYERKKFYDRDDREERRGGGYDRDERRGGDRRDDRRSNDREERRGGSYDRDERRGGDRRDY